MATLSICMIVKNEEGNLPKTLPVFAAIADEMIVVDTGSTDRTVEIAEKLGAKVFHFKWINDFGAARNESIKHATGDWILWLDADEFMKPQDLLALKEALQTLNVDLAYMPIAECLYGTTEEKSRYYRDKLFRNHRGIHFDRPINEQVTFPANAKHRTTRLANLPIYHWGRNLSDEKMAEKNKERARMFENILNEKGDDPHYHFLLASRYLDLGNKEGALKELAAVLDCANDTSDRFIKEGAYLRRGWMAFEENNFESALTEARSAMALNPNNADSYCLAGAACLALTRTSEAVDILEKSMELSYVEHPILGMQLKYWNFLRYSYLANAYIAQKEYERAMVPLARALFAEPQNETLLNLFTLLSKMIHQLDAQPLASVGA